MMRGLGIALLADQPARQIQLCVTRLRVALDKALQKADGLAR